MVDATGSDADGELVRRAANGDADAFAALVRRHQPSVVAFLRHRMGGGADADDVLQDTLLAAWLQIGKVRDPARFKAWLLQIARNQCRDYYRRRHRREAPVEKPDLEMEPSRFGRGTPGERVVDEILDLRSALQSLSPDQRKVVDAFYLQGFTVSEIAGRTRRPEGTVKRWLFTARHHLRKSLREPTEGMSGE